MIAVELDPSGSKIILTSDRPTPGLGRVVAGARFSKTCGAHWTVPLSMTACRSLRAEFGEALRVGTRLSAWAWEAIEAEKVMRELGDARDTTLTRIPEVSPRLAEAMASRTYQRVGARFIAESATRGGILIADEPGLGKTLEAIGGVIESGVPGPYLVVAPKTAVLSVWAREIPRWWPGATAVTVPDGRAKRDAILNEFAEAAAAQAGSDVASAYPPEMTWLVVHPEIMRCRSYWTCEVCGYRTQWHAGPKSLKCDHESVYAGPRVDEYEFPQIFSVDWGAVIADESDRMLVRATGTPTLARRGMELVPVREGGLRVAMSGTPFRSRPKLLWGTLNWLRPNAYRGFWRWAETYYEVAYGYGGTRHIGSEVREEKRADLDFELRQIMLRRTKAEVAPDMPAKTYVGTPLDAEDATSPVGVWVELSGQQRKLYDQMAQASVAVMEGGTVSAIGLLAEITRLKQFATSSGRLVNGEFEAALPSSKFDWTCEFLEELGYPEAPNAKVVIVSQFTSVLAMFERELQARMGKEWAKGRRSSPLSCMLTGAVTGTARPGLIDRFNGEVGTDSPHIMLLQIKTGGVAITLDTADHMIFLDETWVPDDHIQAEDRIHRVSRPRPVFFHYLRSLDTVEEAIARTGTERRTDSHDILDGRRGVDMARQVLKSIRGK